MALAEAQRAVARKLNAIQANLAGATREELQAVSTELHTAHRLLALGNTTHGTGKGKGKGKDDNSSTSSNDTKASAAAVATQSKLLSNTIALAAKLKDYDLALALCDPLLELLDQGKENQNQKEANAGLALQTFVRRFQLTARCTDPNAWAPLVERADAAWVSLTQQSDSHARQTAAEQLCAGLKDCLGTWYKCEKLRLCPVSMAATLVLRHLAFDWAAQATESPGPLARASSFIEAVAGRCADQEEAHAVGCTIVHELATVLAQAPGTPKQAEAAAWSAAARWLALLHARGAFQALREEAGKGSRALWATFDTYELLAATPDFPAPLLASAAQNLANAGRALPRLAEGQRLSHWSTPCCADGPGVDQCLRDAQIGRAHV
jgi:hypothetical protein